MFWLCLIFTVVACLVADHRRWNSGFRQPARERTGDGQPRLAGIRLQPQLRVCVQKSQLP